MHETCIGIPTKGRKQKLSNCIESIDIDARVCLYCYNAEDDIPKMYHSLFDIVEDEKLLTIASHNLCTSTHPNTNFLGLSDDIEFHPGALQKGIDCLYDNYPDSDGVVYFNVVNMESIAGAYMLLGSKFIDRFPGRMPYYPGYQFMRASSELRIVANSLNKVTFCEEAKINHYHPCAGYKADETHQRIRKSNILENDRKLFEGRRNEGKLWGINEFDFSH